MTRVVLASASTGRLRILRQAGIDPLVVVSDVDEDAVIASLDADTPPEAVVATLANEKALSVAAKLDAHILADCVVIGCDSMLHRDGKLWGKPGSVVAAREQWRAMAGTVGHLLTGHTVLRVAGGLITHTEVETGSTAVHFGTPSGDELEAYLATGEPLAVAGAFTLDGLGSWFVDRIDGDPSNVIGLSLPLLTVMLSRMALSPTGLWS